MVIPSAMDGDLFKRCACFFDQGDAYLIWVMVAAAYDKYSKCSFNAVQSVSGIIGGG